MKCLIYVLCGALTATNALGAGCDWATDTPADDANYKYFVAKSYSEASASDAANKAEQDIDAQLGRLFGTKLDVQSEFYADETRASGTTRTYERAIGVITLKGLERQKSDVEKTSHGWTGCVQYRYSKAEIKAEQERLKTLSPTELKKSQVFTEVAGDTQCKGAPVEVVTTPSGAYVTIDNGKYQGSAPIKFGNVCNGRHTLEITSANYEPVSETLIVPTSGRISKNLKRATKRITVRTTLGNSKIEINGISKGKEPIIFDAPLGIEQTITAINDQAVKITRTRTFSKESDDKYTITMEKLPGKLDFTAFKVRNPGVDIAIDGVKLRGGVSKELDADDWHVLTFSKDGYRTIRKNVSVKGGETTYYPSKELDFSKKNNDGAGVLLAAGINRSADSDIGFNIDLGMDTNATWLYLGAGIQLNYIPLPSAHMNFKYYGSHTADIDNSYWELLYSNLGINFGNRLSVYGIGSIGVVASSLHNVSARIIDERSLHFMFRYGVGLQYIISKHENKEFGVRLAYLTGRTKISGSDINIRPINNQDKGLNTKSIEVQGGDLEISNFNVSLFVRF